MLKQSRDEYAWLSASPKSIRQYPSLQKNLQTMSRTRIWCRIYFLQAHRKSLRRIAPLPKVSSPTRIRGLVSPRSFAFRMSPLRRQTVFRGAAEILVCATTMPFHALWSKRGGLCATRNLRAIVFLKKPIHESQFLRLGQLPSPPAGSATSGSFEHWVSDGAVYASLKFNGWS